MMNFGLKFNISLTWIIWHYQIIEWKNMTLCGSNDYSKKEGNRNANPVICKLTVQSFSGFLRLKKNHNHTHNHNHHRHLLFNWFAINKTSFEGAEAREPMQKVIPFLITKTSFDLRQSDFRVVNLGYIAMACCILGGGKVAEEVLVICKWGGRRW